MSLNEKQIDELLLAFSWGGDRDLMDSHGHIHGIMKKRFKEIIEKNKDPVKEAKAEPAPAPQNDRHNYIQVVPDHCDRIVWRNNYYHLPRKSGDNLLMIPGDTLEDNVRSLLSTSQFTVKDLSGERTGSRAEEDLIGSLCLTFMKMESLAREAVKAPKMTLYGYAVRLSDTGVEIIVNSDAPEAKRGTPVYTVEKSK